MRPIHLFGWLLLCLPLACAAGNDPYLLTLNSSSSHFATTPAGYTSFRVNEDAAIHAAAARSGLWIPLPDGSRVHLDYSDKVVHSDGTWTFIGSASGTFNAPKSLITFGDGAVFGAVYTTSGKSYILTTRQGRSWLVDSRRTQPPGTQPEPARSAFVPDHTAANAPARSAAAVAQKEATASDPVTVDLLVVYTTDFRTSLGSTSAAIARIDYLVDTANQVLQDSQVYGRIRLVHAAEVPYTGDPKYALEDLSGINRTVPESLSSVAPMRAQYGADAVTMMQMYEPSSGSCGSYWALGQNLDPITSADAAKAYSVLEEDAALDCDPSGYGLVETLGSNFGLVPALSDNAGTGAYPFSYAYIGTIPYSGGGQFCTLLAEDLSSSLGCKRLPYFSNPNITASGWGVPLGVPDQADAARSLNLTLPIIASFVKTTSAHDDVDADRKSDLLWYGRDVHEFIYWLMDGAKMQSWTGLSLPSEYQPVGVGDFNGDGYADFLWVDHHRNLYMWASDGAGGFTNHFVTTYNAYRVAGVADVDGDGKSDIIWCNPTAGGMIYWLMDGWTMRSWRSFGLKPINHLAGVGDFNGDGRIDLLWAQDSTRNVYAWFGNGSGGFGGVLVNTYKSGWDVAGVGDANGDGKSDIFWYNQGTGQFTYWLMNGAQKTSWRGFTIDRSYHPVLIADFNGNGKADVLWTNDARDLLMSVDNGAGGFNPKLVTQYSANYVPFGN